MSAGVDPQPRWTELAARFGSPLYVYDLAAVRAAAALLVGALPAGAELLYSVKANPHPALVGALSEAACGAEVSSLSELRVAREAGMDLATKVIYTGPAKTAGELRAALRHGARLFSTDSAAQLVLLADVASAERADVRTVLRINPERGVSGAGLAMTGVPSQFGVDSEQVLAAPAALASRPGCEVVGLHFYLGTNNPAAEALATVFASSLELSARLCAALRMRPEILDLGGGFSRPYAQPDEPPDLAGLRGSIETAAERYFPTRADGGPRLVFESGRFLVGSSGWLLATVVDVKSSKGKAFAVLDSGIHHLAGMPALGRVPRLRVAVATPGAEVGTQPVDIVGPLCTPLDWWRRNAGGPLERGQLVVVPNVGAYGLTASLVAFLSRELPVEVVIDEDTVVEASVLQLERRRLPISARGGSVAGDDLQP